MKSAPWSMCPTWHVSWVKFSLVDLGRQESLPLLPPPLAPQVGWRGSVGQVREMSQPGLIPGPGIACMEMRLRPTQPLAQPRPSSVHCMGFGCNWPTYSLPTVC